MYRYFLIVFLFFLFINTLAQNSHIYQGKATYYSKKFDGRRTYSGERFNSNKYTAAHRNFPLQSLVKVTNPQNNKSVIVRINDRFRKKNFIDVSLIAAKQIDIIRQGIAKVKIQQLDSSYMQEYLKQSIDNNLIELLPKTISDTNNIDTTHYFYLRLASFKLRKTAELFLSKKLQKKHTYTAIIQKTKHKGKPLYKVIIGPFSTKEEANIEKNKLNIKDAVMLSNSSQYYLNIKN
jgi:rare lipoprotein A